MNDLLGHNWMILQKDGDTILSVRRADGLVLNVGDKIRTYGIEITHIVRFKITSSNTMCYNCDTPFMEKHDASISNINEVLPILIKSFKDLYD